MSGFDHTFLHLLASFDEITLAPGPAATAGGLPRGGDLHFDAHANVGY